MDSYTVHMGQEQIHDKKPCLTERMIFASQLTQFKKEKVTKHLGVCFLCSCFLCVYVWSRGPGRGGGGRGGAGGGGRGTEDCLLSNPTFKGNLNNNFTFTEVISLSSFSNSLEKQKQSTELSKNQFPNTLRLYFTCNHLDTLNSLLVDTNSNSSGPKLPAE